MIELMKHQKLAISQLSSGKILWGGVGTGKSATVLGYYMEKEAPKDICVITTAKKRDSLEWEKEAARFGISPDPEATCSGAIIIDSWNNIKKFEDYKDYFFVFDEQRLVGSGAWTKSFLKIAKNNSWVLLSATPGDTWIDYIPVFVANGFYKNATEFKMKHVVYEPFSRYPKIRKYLNEAHLEVLRNDVLVEMPFIKNTVRVINYIDVDYDKHLFDIAYKERWNVYEERPVKDVSELFRLIRRVVNTDPSRLDMIRTLIKCHKKLIIFYTFNYELDILRTLSDEINVYEWNGHKKDPIPVEDSWVYLVQYTAGAEGWNCTTTNAMVLYSMTYSYKNFIQAQGRIDRLDTPYKKLYYYVLTSNSVIDRAIKDSLTSKKNFNERKFIEDNEKFGPVFDV
jgi:hypothetical protein